MTFLLTPFTRHCRTMLLGALVCGSLSVQAADDAPALKMEAAPLPPPRAKPPASDVLAHVDAPPPLPPSEPGTNPPATITPTNAPTSEGDATSATEPAPA